jgi:small basic protein
MNKKAVYLILMPLLGLILGLFIGFLSPFAVPAAYVKYCSVALLVALDTILGGVRAFQENQFDSAIFLSGFVVNMLAAAGLAYIGDILGLDLYLAAVIAFGTRLFQNISIIRRHILHK